MWISTLSTFVWVAGFLALSFSKPTQSTSIFRRLEHNSRSLWKRSDHVLNKRDRVTFRFALSQAHAEEIQEWLMKISHPDSSEYGNHWTPQQVAAYFAPTPEAKQAVTDWLVNSGVEASEIQLSKSKGFLMAKLSIGHAERMLKAEYHHYEHQQTGAITLATTTYELPEDVKNHIDFITPGAILAPQIKLDQGVSTTKKLGSHVIPTVSRTLALSVTAVSGSQESFQPPTQPASVVPSNVNNSYIDPSVKKPVAPQGVCALRKGRRRRSASSSNSTGLQSHNTTSTTGLQQPHHTPNTPGLQQPHNTSNITGLQQPHNTSTPKSGLSNTSVPCGTEMSPECLKQLYKFGDYVQKAADKNSFGIIEITPQTAHLDDFDLFFKKFAPEVVGSRPNVVSIDGGELDPGLTIPDYVTESNLDLQYAMALAHPLKVQLLQIGDTDQEAGLNNFLDAVDAAHCQVPLTDGIDGIYPNPNGYNKRDCGTVNSPKVVSLSYGHNEMEASVEFLTRQCQEFGKLGLMGITLLSASGDNGVGGHYSVCLKNSTTETRDGQMFNPTWPSTCPFITSVGATQLPRGGSITDPESACYTRISSGGGFSNFFATPDYQKKALSDYFTSYKPKYTSKQYNDSQKSRGYPDLSANGAGYVPVVTGHVSVTYGTSAATPTVAALLTLVNDARLAVNKSPIGFINTAIYSERFREGFKDIINGTNPGCGTEGFEAVKGWDPLTGVGTPDFSKLLPLWLALP